METGSKDEQSRGLTRHLLLIFGVVLLLRLPFLTQAIQGDDPYYLLGAEHALIDPVHPSHARYIFQGEMVDMRGHPHPPLNAWFLAGLLAVFGDVYETVFHAAYMPFSLLAALGMYLVARRFSPRPLAATLLFVAVPAFVVNGTSLESDLPFLAFWMLAFGLFVNARYVWSVLPLALAAMSAYQAVVAVPILAVYCWLHDRRNGRAWIVAFTPAIVVMLYWAFEKATSGTLPPAVLAGYFQSYGLQQLGNKLKNAAALTAHTGWLVFPALAALAFRSRWPVGLAAAIGGAFIDANPLFWMSFAVGAMVVSWGLSRNTDFLASWILLFYVAALVLFFAGSARYLLPMAAPVAILAAAQNRRWVYGAVAANLILGLSLAWVNYQHWNGYRQFARSVPEAGRVWINGEWGLRFYVEADGGLPLAKTTAVQPGDLIVSSELGFPRPVTAPLALVREEEIRATLPLRLIALGSKSGYSTASLGFRPFDFSSGPIDRVRLEAVLERKPVLSDLPMSAPEARNQIVSGIYQLEDKTRWMSGEALLLLRPPPRPEPLYVTLYIPDIAPARQVTVFLDHAEVAARRFEKPGLYTIMTGPLSGSSVSIVVDKTFSVPGDYRQLGVILSAVGFRPLTDVPAPR